MAARRSGLISICEFHGHRALLHGGKRVHQPGGGETVPVKLSPKGDYYCEWFGGKETALDIHLHYATQK